MGVQRSDGTGVGHEVAERMDDLPQPDVPGVLQLQGTPPSIVGKPFPISERPLETDAF